jgi:hypothetical protein
MTEAASETSCRPYVWENGQCWRQYSYNNTTEWSRLMKQHRHIDSAKHLQRLRLNTCARKLVLVLEMADNWQYVRKAPFWLECNRREWYLVQERTFLSKEGFLKYMHASMWVFLWQANINLKKLYLFVSHLFKCLANMIIVTGGKFTEYCTPTNALIVYHILV